MNVQGFTSSGMDLQNPPRLSITQMVERCMLQDQKFANLDSYLSTRQGHSESVSNLRAIIDSRGPGSSQPNITLPMNPAPNQDPFPPSNRGASARLETHYVRDDEAFGSRFYAADNNSYAALDYNGQSSLVSLGKKVRAKEQGEGNATLPGVPPTLKQIIDTNEFDYKSGFLDESSFFWLAKGSELYLWNYLTDKLSSKFVFPSSIDAVGSVLLKPFVTLIEDTEIMLALQKDFVSINQTLGQPSKRPRSSAASACCTDCLVEYFYSNALKYAALKYPKLLNIPEKKRLQREVPGNPFVTSMDSIRQIGVLLALRNGELRLMKLSIEQGVPQLSTITSFTRGNHESEIVTAIAGHQSSGRLFIGDSSGGLYELFYQLVDVVVSPDDPSATKTRVSYRDKKVLLGVDYELIGINNTAGLGSTLTQTLKKIFRTRSNSFDQQVSSPISNFSASSDRSIISIKIDEYRGIIAALQNDGSILLMTIPKPAVESDRTSEYKISCEVVKGSRTNLCVKRRDIENQLSMLCKDWKSMLTVENRNSSPTKRLTSSVLNWFNTTLNSPAEKAGELNIRSIEFTSVFEADDTLLVLITGNGGRIYLASDFHNERLVNNTHLETYNQKWLIQHATFSLPRQLRVINFRPPPTNLSKITNAVYSDGLFACLSGTADTSVLLADRSQEHTATLQCPDAYPHAPNQNDDATSSAIQTDVRPPLIEIWNQISLAGDDVIRVSKTPYSVNLNNHSVRVLGMWIVQTRLPEFSLISTGSDFQRNTREYRETTIPASTLNGTTHASTNPFPAGLCGRINSTVRPVNPYDIHGLKYFAKQAENCMNRSSQPGSNMQVSVCGPTAINNDIRNQKDYGTWPSSYAPYFVKCQMCLSHLRSPNSECSPADILSSCSDRTGSQKFVYPLACLPSPARVAGSRIVIFTTQGVLEVHKRKVHEVVDARISERENSMSFSNAQYQLREYFHHPPEQNTSQQNSNQAFDNKINELLYKLNLQFREEQVWTALWQILLDAFKKQIDSSYDNVYYKENAELKPISSYARRLKVQQHLGLTTTDSQPEIMFPPDQQIPVRLLWIITVINRARAVGSYQKDEKKANQISPCWTPSITEYSPSTNEKINVFEAFRTCASPGFSPVLTEPPQAISNAKPTSIGIPSPSPQQTLYNKVAHNSRKFTTSLGYGMNGSNPEHCVDNVHDKNVLPGAQSNANDSHHNGYKRLSSSEVAYHTISFFTGSSSLSTLYRDNVSHNPPQGKARTREFLDRNESVQPCIGVTYSPLNPKLLQSFGLRMPRNKNAADQTMLPPLNRVLHMRAKSLTLFLSRLIRQIWDAPLFDSLELPYTVYERTCNRIPSGFNNSSMNLPCFKIQRRNNCSLHHEVLERAGTKRPRDEPHKADTATHFNVMVLRGLISEDEARSLQERLVDLSCLCESLVYEALITVYMEFFPSSLVPKTHSRQVIDSEMTTHGARAYYPPHLFDSASTNESFMPPTISYSDTDERYSPLKSILPEKMIAICCGLISTIHRTKEEHHWQRNPVTPDHSPPLNLTLSTIESVIHQAINRSLDVFNTQSLSTLVEAIRVCRGMADILQAYLLLVRSTGPEVAIESELFDQLTEISAEKILRSEEARQTFRNALLFGFVDLKSLLLASEGIHLTEPLLFTTKELMVHACVQTFCLRFSPSFGTSKLAAKPTALTNGHGLFGYDRDDNTKQLTIMLEDKIKPVCLWFDIGIVLEHVLFPMKRYDLAVSLISHKANTIQNISAVSSARPNTQQNKNGVEALCLTHCYKFLGKQLSLMRTTNAPITEAQTFVTECLKHSDHNRIHEYIFDWIQKEGQGSYPEALVNLKSQWMSKYLMKHDLCVTSASTEDLAKFVPDFQLGKYLVKSKKWLEAASYYFEKATARWSKTSIGSDLSNTAGLTNHETYDFDEVRDEFCRPRAQPQWMQTLEWLQTKSLFPSLPQRLKYLSWCNTLLGRSEEKVKRDSEANHISSFQVERSIAIVENQMALTRECIRVVSLCLLEMPTLLSATTDSLAVTLLDAEQAAVLRTFYKGLHLPDVILQLLFALQFDIYASEGALLSFITKANAMWSASDCPSYRITLRYSPCLSSIPLFTTLVLLNSHKQVGSSYNHNGATKSSKVSTMDQTYKLSEELLQFASSAASILHSPETLTISVGDILGCRYDEPLVFHAIRTLHQFSFEHFILQDRIKNCEQKRAMLPLTVSRALKRNQLPMLNNSSGSTNLESWQQSAAGLPFNGHARMTTYYLWPSTVLIAIGVPYELLIKCYSAFTDGLRSNIVAIEHDKDMNTPCPRATVSGVHWKIGEPSYLTSLQLIGILIYLFKNWMQKDETFPIPSAVNNRKNYSEFNTIDNSRSCSITELCLQFYEDGDFPQSFSNYDVSREARPLQLSSQAEVYSSASENMIHPGSGFHQRGVESAKARKLQTIDTLIEICKLIETTWQRVDQAIVEPLLSETERVIISLVKSPSIRDYLAKNSNITDQGPGQIRIVAYAILLDASRSLSLVGCDNLVEACEKTAHAWRWLLDSLASVQRKFIDYRNNI